MSDYPMLISNKLHSFRNFNKQIYNFFSKVRAVGCSPFAKKENHLSILGVMLIVILYIVFDVSVSHRSISSR